MTTGSKISDRTQVVNIVKNGTQVLGTSLIGSFSSREWSGGDSPPRTKQVYERQFYYIPILKPATPAKNVWKTTYEKVRKDFRVLVSKANKVVVRYGPKNRRRRVEYTPAVYKIVTKTVRVKRKRLVTVPGKPAKVVLKLRYRRVANPRPPRVSLGEHPYTCIVKEWSDSLGTASRKVWPDPDSSTQRDTTAVTMRWFYSEAPPVAENWGANDDLRMLGKLREKVAGSSFNFAVFLAEGSQALGMIANAATRIDRAITSLKKGNLQKAWKALSGDPVPKGLSPRKEAHQNWLEMQYGWLPLLSDAEAGAQFLAHLSLGGSPQVVRARSKKVLKPFSAVDGSGAYRAVGFDCVTYCSVKAILTDVSQVGLSGLLDPLSVIWEKLPWSFVADWFIPIGSFLDARGLAASLQGTFVTTKTTRSKWGGVVLVKNPDSSDPYKNRFDPGPYTYRKVEVNRTVSTTLQVPMPAVKPLSQALSWKRAANAVALLSQRHG